jgi:hypothetical protein
MSDHFRDALGIIKHILEEGDQPKWADRISAHITHWDEHHNLSHHLEAYQGNNSLEHVMPQLGIGDRAIWMGKLFISAMKISYNMANGTIKEAPSDPRVYLTGDKWLNGWKCLSCGHARLDKVAVENHLGHEYLPKFLVQLTQENRLLDVLDLEKWINTEEVRTKRESLYQIIDSSSIDLLEGGEWLNRCPKCESDQVAMYQWIFDQTETKLYDVNMQPV